MIDKHKQLLIQASTFPLTMRIAAAMRMQSVTEADLHRDGCPQGVGTPLFMQVEGHLRDLERNTTGLSAKELVVLDFLAANL